MTDSTQGLGQAIARRLVGDTLAQALVICGRTVERGQRLAREFNERGCRTEYVPADLAAVDDCRRVVETPQRALGSRRRTGGGKKG